MPAHGLQIRLADLNMDIGTKMDNKLQFEYLRILKENEEYPLSQYSLSKRLRSRIYTGQQVSSVCLWSYPFTRLPLSDSIQ